MAVNWMEPPEWWVKWKPLRWVLALLVIYWIFGTLLPRLRTETETVATPVAEEAAAPTSAATITAPAPTPPAPTPPPVAPKVEPAKPPVVVPPKPQPPTPAPVAKPTPTPPAPVKPPIPATPKPAPAAPKPAPVASAATPQAQSEEAPDPMERYTAVESTRVNLISALRSYESVEAVQALLSKSGHAAQLSTIQRKIPNNRYPPYRNDTLVVSAYKDASFTGTLTLEFFNDRLYQAHFVPAQPPEYLRWQRNQGLSLPEKRTGRSSITRGHLRVTTNIDFASSEVGKMMQTAPYMLWEDTRLVQQMSDWGPVP